MYLYFNLFWRGSRVLTNSKLKKAKKNKKDNELEEAGIGCQNITECVRVRDVDARVLDVVVPMKCDSECGMVLRSFPDVRESEYAERTNVGQAECVGNMGSVKPKKRWTNLRNGLFGWRIEKVGRRRLKESVNNSKARLESSSTANNFFSRKINGFEKDTGKVPVDVSSKTNISSGGVIDGKRERESDPDQD